jgi:hypothetical protein
MLERRKRVFRYPVYGRSTGALVDIPSVRELEHPIEGLHLRSRSERVAQTLEGRDVGSYWHLGIADGAGSEGAGVEIEDLTSRAGLVVPVESLDPIPDSVESVGEIRCLRGSDRQGDGFERRTVSVRTEVGAS